jgi:hypothetical protein
VVEEVPASVRLAALAALSQRHADLAVADLDAEGSESGEDEAGRTLSFSTADRRIEIVLDAPVGDRYRLHIRLDPPTPARVEVWHPGELVVAGETDNSGVVDLDGVSPGPLSVTCRTTDKAAVGLQTSWVTL